MTDNQALRHQLDRAAIEDVLRQYCRGVDRRDFAMLKNVYWPDATDDHGFYAGNGQDFAHLNVNASSQLFAIMRHSITNVWCRFECDDRAHVESYLLAYHRVRGNGERCDLLLGPDYMAKHGEAEFHDYLVGGEYFDLFERRDGEWRILHRKSTVDWDMVQPSTGTLYQGYFRNYDALPTIEIDAAAGDVTDAM